MLESVVRYGFQVLGAAVILAGGAFAARCVGALMQQWLDRHDLEPPVKLLLVRLECIMTSFHCLALDFLIVGTPALAPIVGEPLTKTPLEWETISSNSICPNVDNTFAKRLDWWTSAYFEQGASDTHNLALITLVYTFDASRKK